jgi:CRAL/TRIO domain
LLFPKRDMKNITIRHFSKLSLSTMRLFLKYTQVAHPVKVRQLHVINCNALLNKALGLAKPFLKTEVAERIHFHIPNSDTLYQYIPKEILPEVCKQF